jgi:putative modified peptide
MPFKLSEAIVDSLLDKLGNDDEFRTLFQANPRQALASLGHQPASDKGIDAGAWTCMAAAPLASKSAIKASQAALRQQLLTQMAVYSPIHLQSS